MDNKYALGSTKVATEHHEASLKTDKSTIVCKYCDSDQLVMCPTMQDHKCAHCGEWQQDISKSYATGRSSDF
jgi:hypothetical protein